MINILIYTAIQISLGTIGYQIYSLYKRIKRRQAMKALFNTLDIKQPDLVVKFKKLNSTATTPTRAYDSDDAGLDLYASEGVRLRPGVITSVDLGLAFELPKGHYGRIVGRSGNAIKKQLQVIEGTLDSTFRGSVSIMVMNCNDDTVLVKKGDKITQMIVMPYPAYELQEVSELSETTRGEKGFGSSDK